MARPAEPGPSLRLPCQGHTAEVKPQQASITGNGLLSMQVMETGVALPGHFFCLHSTTPTIFHASSVNYF